MHITAILSKCTQHTFRPYGFNKIATASNTIQLDGMAKEIVINDMTFIYGAVCIYSSSYCYKYLMESRAAIAKRIAQPAGGRVTALGITFPFIIFAHFSKLKILLSSGSPSAHGAPCDGEERIALPHSLGFVHAVPGQWNIIAPLKGIFDLDLCSMTGNISQYQ